MHLYLDSGVTRTLVNDSSIVTEGIFSMTNDSIFFTKAQEYRSYSPIGVEQPHKFDIYFKGMSTSFSPKKISNLSAYSIQDINLSSNGNLLFSMTDDDSGSFFLNTRNFSVSKITTTNDTLRNCMLYSNPIMVNNGLILCSSSYQLVVIDLKARKEKTILPSSGSHFKCIRYNKKTDLIYFTKTTDRGVIHVVDVNGNELRTIHLKL